MFGGRLNGVMVGLIGLNDDPAAQQAPSGAAGYLGQYLKRPFTRLVIGQPQRNVGRDHAHQGHQRQVQPFGNHLRAHQDVGFLVDEAG